MGALDDERRQWQERRHVSNDELLELLRDTGIVNTTSEWRSMLPVVLETAWNARRRRARARADLALYLGAVGALAGVVSAVVTHFLPAHP